MHRRIWDHRCFGMLGLSAPAILVFEGPKAWRLKSWLVVTMPPSVVFCGVLDGVLGVETARLPCNYCPVAYSYSAAYRRQAPEKSSAVW